MKQSKTLLMVILDYTENLRTAQTSRLIRNNGPDISKTKQTTHKTQFPRLPCHESLCVVYMLVVGDNDTTLEFLRAVFRSW